MIRASFILKNQFGFATTVIKKQKMEITIRTPYQTYLKNFSGFSRVITKTNEASLVIQNKAPPALYILPPGHLKVKLSQETKGVTGDFFHLGGWAIIHLYALSSSSNHQETTAARSTLWTSLSGAR